ncbi:MAG TPA: hypothetical protein VHH94_06120 [Gammaproteobacteria bacterium]|nr:hypothetical protein [Gammaproteobacteria bacterium]
MKGGIWWAGWLSGSLLLQAAYADDYRTPRAGEEYRTALWGIPITAPARNRRHVTALDLGLQWIPDGPISPLILPLGGALVVRDRNEPGSDLILPFGAVFVWRNEDYGKKRFRGVFSGLYNDLRYNIAPEFLQGAEAVFTFENFTVPFGRPEFVEGRRIRDVDLEWQYVRGGLGLGYRTPLAPGHQDNTLEITLSYEPGFFWFDSGDDTAQDFIVPHDTYEGRAHLRLRADALERNILELSHRGFSAGSDLVYGHRANWRDWGGSVFGVADADEGRDYFAASFYAVAAGAVPFVDSERHRLIASAYAGLGTDLDRFSAFRLAGRPDASEWEAISRPNLPGAAFDEFFSRSYGIVDLRYRYEALFFLYPYVYGNWAWIDRPRRFQAGSLGHPMDSLPTLGAGIITGAPWRSRLELNYAYNFGILRNPERQPEFGGHSIIVHWSKEF